MNEERATTCQCICSGCKTAGRHCGRVQDCGQPEFDYRVDTGMVNRRSIEDRRKQEEKAKAKAQSN
jgi:hypothetical protein